MRSRLRRLGWKSLKRCAFRSTRAAHVRDALADLTLLRASLDNCKSFTRTPNGEYGLTLVMPLGALRARYEIRVHKAGRTPKPKI